MLRRLLAVGCVAVVVSGCAGVDPALTGETLYERQCLECHGAELEGTPEDGNAIGAGSPSADMTDAELRDAIRQGNTDEGMPAFNLSHEEMSLLMGYLRDRQQPEIDPAQPTGTGSVTSTSPRK